MILIEFYDYLYLFDQYGFLIGFRTYELDSTFFYDETTSNVDEVLELIHLPKLKIDNKQFRIIHKQQLCDLFQVLAESGESYVLSLNNDDVDLYNWLTTYFKDEIFILHNDIK